MKRAEEQEPLRSIPEALIIVIEMAHFTILKWATEATIWQEQAITTNYIRKHIFKTEHCDLCRVCLVEKETIEHIISGCVTLAPTKSLQRGDSVCKYIHALLLERHGFTEKKIGWYEHQPKSVEENEATNILWNFSFQTDHIIPHNKPDIVVVEKRKKEAINIDVAIPNDHNLGRKRLDKLRAYTDLSVEIKALYGTWPCACNYWCDGDVLQRLWIKSHLWWYGIEKIWNA